VGDDARLSLLEVSLESKVVGGRKILKDMAHASAIVGKSFSNFQRHNQQRFFKQ